MCLTTHSPHMHVSCTAIHVSLVHYTKYVLSTPFLGRAQEPVKRRVGKPVMFRSTLSRDDKKEEEEREESADEEAELNFYLALP